MFVDWEASMLATALGESYTEQRSSLYDRSPGRPRPGSFCASQNPSISVPTPLCFSKAGAEKYATIVIETILLAGNNHANP